MEWDAKVKYNFDETFRQGQKIHLKIKGEMQKCHNLGESTKQHFCRWASNWESPWKFYGQSLLGGIWKTDGFKVWLRK